MVLDALSRKDEEISAYAVSVIIPEWLEEIRIEYAKDPVTCSIINNMKQHPKFEWRNDIL